MDMEKGFGVGKGRRGEKELKEWGLMDRDRDYREEGLRSKD